MSAKPNRWILPMAVLAVLAVAAAAVRSDDGSGSASSSSAIRMETRAGPDGQVRVFINGREVQPEAAAEPARGGAFLGVVAAAVPEGMDQIAGTDKGVLINTLIDDSPAARADLMPGDVVTAVDGKEVDTPEAFVKIIRSHKPGDQVQLTYYRMGKRRTATVTLGSRPEQPKDAFRLRELPEDLYRSMPNFGEYWGRIQPELKDYMNRMRDWAERERERIAPGRPEEAPPAEEPRPYDVGKDVGRILERLDRIQRQLDDVDRRLNDMDKRLDRLERR